MNENAPVNRGVRVVRALGSGAARAAGRGFARRGLTRRLGSCGRRLAAARRLPRGLLLQPQLHQHRLQARFHVGAELANTGFALLTGIGEAIEHIALRSAGERGGLLACGIEALGRIGDSGQGFAAAHDDQAQTCQPHVAQGRLEGFAGILLGRHVQFHVPHHGGRLP